MVLLLLSSVQELPAGWTRPQLILTFLHGIKSPSLFICLFVSFLTRLQLQRCLAPSEGNKLSQPSVVPGPSPVSPAKPSSVFSLFPTLYPLGFGQCSFLPVSFPVLFLAFEMPSPLHFANCKANPSFKAWLFCGTLYWLRYGFAAFDKTQKSKIDVYLSLM